MPYISHSWYCGYLWLCDLLLRPTVSIVDCLAASLTLILEMPIAQSPPFKLQQLKYAQSSPEEKITSVKSHQISVMLTYPELAIKKKF